MVGSFFSSFNQSMFNWILMSLSNDPIIDYLMSIAIIFEYIIQSSWSLNAFVLFSIRLRSFVRKVWSWRGVRYLNNFYYHFMHVPVEYFTIKRGLYSSLSFLFLARVHCQCSSKKLPTQVSSLLRTSSSESTCATLSWQDR